jgi:hypothetical protein
MPTPPAPPFAADPQWFSKLLDAVLAKAVAILGANAPTRAYVAAGTPVPDCGQLTVHAERFRPSQPLTRSQAEPQGVKQIASVADVVVTYYRCASSLSPEGQIPDEATLDADGKAMADIGATLWLGLIGATIDRSLFPALVQPEVLWRDCAQLSPQANLAGWKATLEVSLT